MDREETFATERPLVGMVHLPALPGAPDYEGSRDAIRQRALDDARTLAAGGVDGVLVENFGDVPFYPDEVPSHVVADLTAVVDAVRRELDLPVGVNVLRNDVAAALSVAAATDGAFVRANLHTGVQVTDQGILQGRAHETVRQRERIDADVAILADVSVKHAASLAERPIAEVAVETAERGLADGLIVTGPATGEPTDADELHTVVESLADAGLDIPVFVGSGVTAETVGEAVSVADGAIVGTALKADGETTNPVDETRVRRLVEAASDGG